MLFVLLSLAHADDDNFFFVGGGGAIRPGFGPVLYPAPSEASGFSLWGEAELDVRFQAGIIGGRFDFDVTGTALPDLGVVKAPALGAPVIDVVRPEWAMVQAGGDTWVARGGIVNAAFGLEDWDDWALYLPTHGQYFAWSPGRMLGGEVGWTFGDGGPSVAIGGGLDMDFEEPIVESNVTYSDDAFAVYSGVAIYPAMGQYEAVLGAEGYPAEFVTIALGGLVGVDAGSPFGEASLYGVFLPEGMFSPTVRVEGGFDPDGITGGAPWAASVGGAIKPTEWSKILVEGKLLGLATGPVPGAYASVSLFRPEPSDE